MKSRGTRVDGTARALAGKLLLIKSTLAVNEVCMQELFQDIRRAMRQLSKAPGFSVTVLLTLALGVGATTAIFTLVYDVMLRPLPFKHADRIVVLEEQVAEFRDIYPKLPVTANHFVNWERNGHSFEALTAIEQNSMPMGTEGHPIQVKAV